MSHSLKIERVFRLPASPSSVWQSLVSPALVSQYHYNRELAGTTEKQHECPAANLQDCPAFLPGGILEYEEGRKVKFSTFDPKAGLGDLAQNYLHISYGLTPLADGVELSVLIENFMENESRYQHSKAGWENMVTPQLTQTLQTLQA